MRLLSRALDLFLQAVTITLLVVLAILVVAAVVMRYSGASLVWYDELASAMLAWLTFSGSAFAAHRNAHLSFNGLPVAVPLPLRRILFAICEIVFIAAFATVGWAGWAILEIFGDERMVALRVPLWITQSIVPIACAFIVLVRLISVPERWRQARAGLDAEALEIEQEIARARREVGADDGPDPRP